MKKEKILYLSSANEQLGNHHYKFLDALAHDNYDVHLVSYHPLPIAKNILDIDGLTVHHHPPRFIKKALFFNRVFHFRKLLKKIKPDILHSGNVSNISFLAALSGFHPLLVMPNGSDILVYPDKYKIINRINNFVFSCTDWVTCDAEYVKNKIINDYSYDDKKITTFPWGIELDIFKVVDVDSTTSIRTKLGWENNVILISNRHFEHVYDHNTLIESFRSALMKNSNLRLLLIGDGKLMNNIKSLVAKYELDDFIHFTGRITRDEMVIRLNESDIYITTSLSDGTSVSLLEAFACKKPVIVSDIPCNKEWIQNGENGFYAKPRDIDMFSEHILKLGEDRQLRESMSLINYNLAQKKADWIKNFKKLKDIYSNLMDI